MEQLIYKNQVLEEALQDGVGKYGIKKLLVVSGHSCSKLEIADRIRAFPVDQIWFSEFKPNPDITSVHEGIRILQKEQCDAIIAIGGGSAMDVAKGIKLYAGQDPDGDLPVPDPAKNAIPFIAIPTTAGTGSEATRFSVVYKNGAKQSLTADWIIPNAVIMLPELLTSLPAYQKKCTVMDAMCHAVESFWSVNSTEESKTYAGNAIRRINENLDAYLASDAEAAVQMMLAANEAGKAINITQTTAGHAMCYKITTLFGTPHGHAAALCVNRLWPYMLTHMEDCIDARGQEYLEKTFSELAEAFGRSTPEEAAGAFRNLLSHLELTGPEGLTEAQLETLVTSVNPDRLKNNPVALSEKAIRGLYQEIFAL